MTEDEPIKGPILYLREACEKSLMTRFYCTDLTSLPSETGWLCVTGVRKALPHLKNAEKIQISITRERTEKSIEASLVNMGYEDSPYPEWSDEFIELETGDFTYETIDITTDFGQWLLECIDDYHPFYINGVSLDVT